MEGRCRHHRESLLEGRKPDPGRECACAGCRRFEDELAAIGDELGRITPPSLPPGFRASLRERLDEEAGTRRRRSVLAGAGLALAAAAAALLLVLAPLEEAVHIRVGHHVLVKLRLEAAAPTDRVEVRVSLPEGLRLAADDPELQGAAQLSWVEDLTKHGAVRSFALRSASAGRWRIRVEARTGEGFNQAEIEIVVDEETVTARLVPEVDVGSGPILLSLSTDGGGNRG